MTRPRILLFDSGMGGLTVARAVAIQSPEAHLVYAADNAGFPYGAWTEAALAARIVGVIRTAEPWTAENGLLTPTLKIKRSVVEGRFAAEIDALYTRQNSRRS